MESAESFLRVAGVVITLLMAVLLVRDSGRTLVGRLAATFSLGVATYMVCSSPGFHELPPYVHIPALALCVSNPIFFWLLARALFDDGFRIVPAHGLIILAFLLFKAVHWLDGGVLSTASDLLLHAAGFGLAAHALWVAYHGRADDLSEERRAFRMPFVVVVGGYSLILVAAETILAGAVAPAPIRVLRGDELLVPRTVSGPATPPRYEESIDAGELARLEALMGREQAWRQDGLTIGKLADQLGLPEYRLRRLINKGLGHRNFTAYLNSYRLEAARAALSDPAKRRLPVLTIGLDLGFGSIGPFNRAFKDATGMAPTEFRRLHLDGRGSNDLADS